MSCNHPYKAFRTGCLTASGKDDYVLVLSEYDSALNAMYARKKKPLNLIRAPHKVMDDGKVYLIDPIPIPCGVCSGCRMDRARMWKDRIVLEASRHKFNYFITLTYADEFLRTDDFGQVCLVKRDLQLFFKRFRKIFPSVRFFACGEYGDHTARPHYHAILFCDRPLPLDIFAVNRYHSPVLARCWTLGLHEVSEANAATMAYVAGYCNKKVKDPDWDAYGVKPFIVMSRRPGIGAAYLVDHDLFKDSLRIYGDFQGKKFGSSSLPRFFRDKIKDTDLFKRFKDRSIEFSKALMLTQKHLIGDSVEAIGQYKDACNEYLLTKKRRLKL